MQKIFLILSLLLLQNTFAQTAMDTTLSQKWITTILQDKNISNTKNTTGLQNYDLSSLLKTDIANLPLGFIGNKYQRFQIIYTSVTKSGNQGDTYFVKGKNKVKSNTCDFTGIITITHESYFKNIQSISKKYPENISLGIFTGTYLFKEDSTQKHVGTLQGNFAIRFWITKDEFVLDGWTINDNDYYNNQYVGTWKSYDGKITQQCNFGNFRIPECGDLDVGEKDFMPNEKYKANGWQTYPELLNTDWWK